MPKLINNSNNESEHSKSKKMILVSLGIVISFIVLGVVLENITTQILKNREMSEPTPIVKDTPKKEGDRYQGRVEYIDPRLNPLDKITYKLVDNSGKQIILLRAQDEKLTVVEGFSVVVFGKVVETKDGKGKILEVKDILISK